MSWLTVGFLTHFWHCGQASACCRAARYILTWPRVSLSGEYRRDTATLDLAWIAGRSFLDSIDNLIPLFKLLGFLKRCLFAMAARSPVSHKLSLNSFAWIILRTFWEGLWFSFVYPVKSVASFSEGADWLLSFQLWDQKLFFVNIFSIRIILLLTLFSNKDKTSKSLRQPGAGRASAWPPCLAWHGDSIKLFVDHLLLNVGIGFRERTCHSNVKKAKYPVFLLELFQAGASISWSHSEKSLWKSNYCVYKVLHFFR